MSRVLVVANQTLRGSDLLQSIRDRISQSLCHFALLVPATAQAHRKSIIDSLNHRR